MILSLQTRSHVFRFQIALRGRGRFIFGEVQTTVHQVLTRRFAILSADGLSHGTEVFGDDIPF